LLSELHSRDHDLPVIVLTGCETIETAVEAMKRGARTLVSKPWDNSRLIETIEHEIARGVLSRKEHERAASEVHEGQRIQRTFLPASLPRIPGCEMAAFWLPAFSVGGDCYDARVDGDQVAVTIADVCGKGLPAALMMSHLQASVRAFAEAQQLLPNELAGRVNRFLCHNNDAGMFVTCFFCDIDVSRRIIRYSNAGHTWPILMRRDGTYERLSHGGVPLGLFESSSYELGEIPFSNGDRLILFTDGVVETTSPGGVEFGDERLLHAARACRTGTAPSMAAQIIETVRLFNADAFSDDATLIVCALGGVVA
jgi:serine phosphatase RsbU (regulator of sigma subunit)